MRVRMTMYRQERTRQCALMLSHCGSLWKWSCFHWCTHRAVPRNHNLGHSGGDNLDNFCAPHEHPRGMQIGVVNGQRPLFENHQTKLRTWKSVRQSTKPHCHGNKCNNTYTGIITFAIGLAQLPTVSATHLHWKGSICGNQTEITFT